MGASSIALVSSSIAPSQSPFSPRAQPRLCQATASVGSSSIALVSSLITPSSSPFWPRATPRLCQTSASVASSWIAFVSSAIAPSRSPSLSRARPRFAHAGAKEGSSSTIFVASAIAPAQSDASSLSSSWRFSSSSERSCRAVRGGLELDVFPPGATGPAVGLIAALPARRATVPTAPRVATTRAPGRVHGRLLGSASARASSEPSANRSRGSRESARSTTRASHPGASFRASWSERREGASISARSSITFAPEKTGVPVRHS